MYKHAFIAFLESLETPDNKNLIQTIQKGYKVLESQLSLFPEKEIKASPERIMMGKAKQIAQESENEPLRDVLDYMDKKDRENPKLISTILKLKNIEHSTHQMLDNSYAITYYDPKQKEHMIIFMEEYTAPADLSEYIIETVGGQSSVDDIIPKQAEHIKDMEDLFNANFWNSPEIVYHGTNEENIKDIKEDGLQPSDEGRGISNRHIGQAVFTSSEPDTPTHYYDKVIAINTPQMAKDNYKPFVSQEPDIQDYEQASALANYYGIEDFNMDVEGGMDHGTIIFYDKIPPKYLAIHET